MLFKKIIAFIILGFISSTAMATDWAYVCESLGQVGECSYVSVCEVEAYEACQPKPQYRGTDWERLCPSAGVNEMGCGWQSNHCVWRSTSSCVPSGRR
ncbi:MAG: hypothetical protein HRT45_15720 [Bdellovibrionales bacterium]|nr:hypothetical protein [Bdellovibrionales bacterium]